MKKKRWTFFCGLKVCYMATQSKDEEEKESCKMDKIQKTSSSSSRAQKNFTLDNLNQ